MIPLIYKKDYETVKNSGVGKAIEHQIEALKLIGEDFSVDEKNDFDVVHINTVFPKSLIFSKKASKEGKAVVYHAHSTEEDFRNSFLLSNFLSPLFKKWIMYCYNSSDILITPTEYSKNILKSYGIKKDIEVISNGIELDFWRKKKEDRENFYKKYNLDKNKKTIISVGLFIKRKGILDFVELAKRLPQFEFVWFGKLNLNLVGKDVRDAVNSNLKNLHFPGFVSSKDLREAYSACDLYLFPTYEETEGIVLLEAIATGAKTIIRDIDIFKNDFKDGINIYKAKNNDEFEEKIINILNGNLKDLTKEARKIAEERSIEKTGEKLVNCYKKAVKIKEIKNEENLEKQHKSHFLLKKLKESF
ncbi:MAG: glycosyltransferase [Peptoniphilaceae bacterium]|nr:glycosyltransferase [Peptoniphilaceae bacterium]MDD7383082.1 glycosyltransferase [Peptoniphilaceae bacterium]MDY3737517.1 glycosyltransferase [Peptoniphilaceae bacterium]